MPQTHTHFIQGKAKGQTTLEAKTVIIPTGKALPQQQTAFRRLLSKLLKDDKQEAASG